MSGPSQNLLPSTPITNEMWHEHLEELIKLSTQEPDAIRTIELHFASGKEGQTEENSVVIPPKKEGKLESVEFEDVKLIRRTMGITNQMVPQEIIQAADPETGIPPYTVSDPHNRCGLPVQPPTRPVLECPIPKRQ